MRTAPVFILLVFYMPLFSQTEKGSFLLNLNGNLTYNEYQDIYNFAGNMKVKVGYAFIDDLFFGAEYSPIYTVDFNNKSRFSIPSYSVFSRYYFLKNKNRIYLHTDFLHNNYSLTSSQNEWNIGVGFAHFLSNNSAVEINFNYNFYNHYNFHSSPNPIDPTYFTQDNPRGLEIFLKMHYFMPSQQHRKEKEEWRPLNERYLFAGNRSLSLEGTIFYKRLEYIGSFEKSKFIKNSLRLNHRFLGYGAYGKNTRPITIAIYLPSIEKYFPLSERLYFTPSAGVGPTLIYFDEFRLKDFGWMATAQVGFSYFLQNALLSSGFTFYASDEFNEFTDLTTNSNLYLSSEFFISEKFAIKSSAFYKAHGDGILFLNFENGRFISARKFRLQFGFSYYY